MTKSRLAAILDDLDRSAARHDPPTMLDATIEFYAVIFASSGHDVAWEIVARLNSRISRLRVMTLSTANRTVSGPARLREIFDAIDRNDPEAAAAACRQHIAEAAKIAEAILTGDPAKALRARRGIVAGVRKPGQNVATSRSYC